MSAAFVSIHLNILLKYFLGLNLETLYLQNFLETCLLDNV